MKRSVRNGLIAAAAVALAAAIVPVTSALGAGSVTATFSVTSDWGTGWAANFTINNGTASTVNGWKLEFDLPGDGAITSSWDADLVQSGQHNTITNQSRANSLAAGASFTWGMNGKGAKPPVNCVITGASCSGGGSQP